MYHIFIETYYKLRSVVWKLLSGKGWNFSFSEKVFTAQLRGIITFEPQIIVLTLYSLDTQSWGRIVHKQPPTHPNTDAANCQRLKLPPHDYIANSRRMISFYSTILNNVPLHFTTLSVQGRTILCTQRVAYASSHKQPWSIRLELEYWDSAYYPEKFVPGHKQRISHKQIITGLYVYWLQY